MDQGHPDALLQRLTEYLALEAKFSPNLKLPHCSSGGDVTMGIRDGTAQVLRCLKIWYDMPPEVLFVAINLVDRFLSKMKARPKHMACIAIASFQLACSLVCRDAGYPRVPEATEVAAISQCKCTSGDLLRMQSIITSKLGINTVPITAIDFLRTFHQLLLSVDRGQVYSTLVDEAELYQRLEIVSCDSSVSGFRPCELALSVMCMSMDAGVSRITQRPSTEDVMAIFTFASQLQHLCKIQEYNFFDCHESVVMIINQYNRQQQQPHRQRLVWKLSHRTLRYLRPTDKLVTTLPTITELDHSLPSASLSDEESWSCDEWPVQQPI